MEGGSAPRVKQVPPPLLGLGAVATTGTTVVAGPVLRAAAAAAAAAADSGGRDRQRDINGGGGGSGGAAAPVFAADDGGVGGSAMSARLLHSATSQHHQQQQHHRAHSHHISGGGGARMLQRFVCCASRVHRALRGLGVVGEDDDSVNTQQMLACACAAVALLLLLLLASVAALVVVLVVQLPDAAHRMQQPVGPLLDVNDNHNNVNNKVSGGTTAAPASPFNIRRLLASGGLRDFLREAHRVEEIRRRVQRNTTLLAELRKWSAARGGGGGGGGARAGGAGGDYDALGLVQTLPELEHLSFLLNEVSVYVRAVQQHDPVMGLVELSNFLLNAKGRAEALERAAARARAEAAGNVSTLPTAAATPTPPPPPPPSSSPLPSVADDPIALANAALKESFAGRAESARLRSQLRGFVSVAAHHAERVVEQPFDDLALLQLRHAWALSEVLPRMRARARLDGDATNETTHNTAAAPSPHAVAERIAAKADVYEVASVLNHRYFYPLRRYAAVRPFGGDAVAETDAWYSAISALVQARLGAVVTVNAAVATAAAPVPLTQREPPLSALALPRLGVQRAADVEHLSTEEDRELMPRALDAAAEVNTLTVFISLASYRDAECAPTVLNLFHTARNPHRVYVGLTQQNRAGDSPCIVPEMYSPYLCPSDGAATAREAREARARARTLFGDGVELTAAAAEPAAARAFDGRVCHLAEQVRVREIDSRQAKGPTYGRYMAMLLYRGEDLVLVLDSHNRFRPMWDVLGTSMLLRFEDPRAALSHYPEGYGGEQADLLPYRTTTAYLCKAYFLKNMGYPRLNGIVIGSPRDFADNNKYNDPYVRVKSSAIDARTNFRLPQPWVAGGFLLSFGTMLRDVPFDPHLPYTFDGEEVLYSMRLWTHGYNIYSPMRGLCFHIYGRATAPKVWSESAVWYASQDRVRRRIQHYLQSRVRQSGALFAPANSTSPFVVVDSSRYGMGRQRTVAQWYDYAGADPVNYTFDGRWCGVDKEH
ncbi:Glycosyltransferase (GlcNAc) [Novymonas esmeraldas]|uniref:Glycosyltransferase (GlcNAc) n=1 Tax=Novymonas esmeraldas TaxID=1808958 RepID=A0AAW0EVP8_9TRYP